MPQFRTKLAEVARQRDGKTLMAMVSADVQIGFAGEDGRRAFATAWHPEDRTSILWPLLERMLALGCAGNGSTRLIPSLGEQLDDVDDPFETLLVAVPAAPLRQAPAADSPTIASLGWDIVHLVERDELQARVRLDDGREGWLWHNQVYGPLDHRMVVQKTGGRWLIVAFVAGD